MLNQNVQDNLNIVKDSCLVFDIETSALDKFGREINIKRNFDEYVENARVKWFGAYSYKHNKYYNINVVKEPMLAKELIEEHNVLIGFNNEEFDTPIIINNGFYDTNRKILQCDCMQILGNSTFKNKNNQSYKGRGALMKYKFKNSKLRHIGEVMGCEVPKGDINYEIFHKDEWTEEETKEIITYLEADVKITKYMFDKLWDYWLPFTEFIDQKFVYNLSWIKSSIASLTYFSACNVLGVEPTYGEHKGDKESMGGNVILPKVREANNVYYLDFSSLYPHIFAMFNLFAETDDEENGWHGNEIFKVKGYYDISKEHPLSKRVKELLVKRTELKKTDPKNSLVYTIKIFLNGLYGVIRSSIFEQVHTENGGWDCCWLGQQLQALCVDMMKQFGFDTIAGDTDSFMCIAINEENNNIEYVRECLKSILEIIFDNVPFKVDTFNIDIEYYINYILFPTPLQPITDDNGDNIKQGNRIIYVRKGLKKNYLFTYTEDGEYKLDIKGMPIIKDTATPLGVKIFNEVLKPEILKIKSAVFEKEYIEGIIEEYVKKPEILELLAVEYKVQPANTYKGDTGIHAQISKGYFNGQEGIISLIKNKEIGKVGKGFKYCTVEEAKQAKLEADDLDLEKVYNELDPFIRINDEKFWVKSKEEDKYLIIAKEKFDEKIHEKLDK